MPSDPARRAVYQAQVARIDEKQERKEEKSLAAAQPHAPPEPAAAEGAKTAEELAAAATAIEPPSPDANATNEMNAGSNDMSPKDATEIRVGADASSVLPGGATHAAIREAAMPRPTSAEEAEARRREDRLYADLQVQALIDLPPNERYKKVLAMAMGRHGSCSHRALRRAGVGVRSVVAPRNRAVARARSFFGRRGGHGALWLIAHC